jgi:hypothetical protein
MTPIDRTAYPHLNKPLTEKELAACYTLNEEEHDFIQKYARSQRGQLILAVMLKTATAGRVLCGLSENTAADHPMPG